MEKINALKRNFSRLLKISASEEDIENQSVAIKNKEEKKYIHWSIENVNANPLRNGEYLESPPFYSGLSNGTKWSLRLYPRGRNEQSLEKVGLYIFKVHSTEKCFINYQVILLDPRRVVGYFEKSVFEDLKEYDTDELLTSEDLLQINVLKIVCNMSIKYPDKAKNFQACEEVPPICSCILSKDLQDLYLNEKYSDVTLKVANTKMPVHKAILTARSKVFANFFKRYQREGSCSDAISIEEIGGPIEESVMRDLLFYFYTGNIDDFTADKAISLYIAAVKFSVTELKKLCLNVILASISLENFCAIAALVDEYSSPKLKLATKKFFRCYSSQILQSQEWKALITERRSLALKLMETLSSEYKLENTIFSSDGS